MKLTDPVYERLMACRPGYAEEVRFGRFLLDSWTGGGGYQGRIRQPASGFWGWASEVYARAASSLRMTAGESWDDGESYLDRFTREDSAKFNRRRGVSHFGNYFKPLTALKLGFLRRVPMFRKDVPEAIEKWKDDVDGRGTAWAAMVRKVELRAAVLGWCPVLFDAAALPEELRERDEVSRAQVREAGADRPRMIPLLPANILDWQVGEDGRLDWAKIRIDRTERESWDEPAVLCSRITFWTRKRWETWEVRRPAESNEGGGTFVAATTAAEVTVEKTGSGLHGFGRVPLVGWKAGEAIDASDPLRAEPIHGDLALRNRRLFNLESELDEHLRSQVFALLQVPAADPAAIKSLEIGTSNAVPVHPDSSQGYSYVAPPATVAETLETRIERMGQEIYRSARVEWVRTSAATTSAASRRSEFDTTNAAIVDMATAFADSELEAYDVVAPILGVPEEQLEAATVTPPDDFEVESLAEDFGVIETALRIDAGPTFRALVLERAVQRFLGRSLDADTLETIREEIGDAVTRAESMAAAMAADPLGLGQAPDGTEPDDEGEDGRDAKGKPGNPPPRPGNPPRRPPPRTPPPG